MIRRALHALHGLRGKPWLALLLAAWMACIGPAHAHKASDAYLTVKVDGQNIQARWDIHVRDIDNLLQLDADDNGQITWGEIRRRWPEIESEAWSQLSVDVQGALCQPDAAAPHPPQLDQHSDGHYLVLSRAWHCAHVPHTLTLGYQLFAKLDALHRGILRIQLGDGRQVSAVLVPGAGARVFTLSAPPSAWQTLAGFVQEGVWHIATGADHLLFLLALLLPSVLRREAPRWTAATACKPVLTDVLRVVTAFTVAHSITLVLSVWGWVQPPVRWVESLIAASVVFAALNNLRPMVGEGRWALTFVFGLVHGFGFASALRDIGLQDAPLGWSLLGFNLGVELGQLAVVAMFVPLAWSLRQTAFYRRQVLAGGSMAIALVAALWLFERAADVSLGWLPG